MAEHPPRIFINGVEVVDIWMRESLRFQAEAAARYQAQLDRGRAAIASRRARERPAE